YELLAAAGVDLGSATQTIVAAAAGDADADALGVRTGAPMLVCHRVTRDRSGRPVLASEHRYPAHRTSFEVELPRVHAGSGAGPVGLHLVEPSATAVSPYPSSSAQPGESHVQH
ncbi:MAG TPA: UTRA domain-containing protein, partial [Acidimicrobiia bacterium]|nr:UTRA domain-containing protein [Acidimicrobiia bacterium]